MLSSCLSYVTVLLGIALAHCSHFATHLMWRYNSQCHRVLGILTSEGSEAKHSVLFHVAPLLVDLGPYCRQAAVQKGLLHPITALNLSKIHRTLWVRANIYYTTETLLYLQIREEVFLWSIFLPQQEKEQEALLEESNCHFIFSFQHLWQNIYLAVAQAVLWARVWT